MIFAVIALFVIGLYIAYRIMMARPEQPFEEVEINTLYPDFAPEPEAELGTEAIVVEDGLEIADNAEESLWANLRIDTFGPVIHAPVVSPVVENFALPEKWSRIESLPPASDDVPWLKPIEVSRPMPVEPLDDVTDDDQE